MLLKSESDVLITPIEHLPFSIEFKLFAEKQHFDTLAIILEMKVADFMKLPGFTYHILVEYVQFLEERQLANRLIQ